MYSKNLYKDGEVKVKENIVKVERRPLNPKVNQDNNQNNVKKQTKKRISELIQIILNEDR